MKVFFDSQIFGLQDYGGISRYYSEIIKRLPENECQVVLPSFIHNNDYLIDSKWGYRDKLFNRFKYRNIIYSLLNFIFCIPSVIKGNYHIFHQTYYEVNYPRVFNRKYVVTVYDLIHEKFKNDFPKLSSRIINKKKNIFNKADRIIAISKNTKKDLIDYYRLDPSKIEVVYLSNSLNKWDGRKRLKLPDRYILFVGQRWMYKNFDNLIIACKEIIKKYPDIHLVCAGGGGLSNQELSRINKYGLGGHVLHVPFNNDKYLSEMYSRAELFVYPSKYEGFGIPILEAFFNSCPVVLSNASCFPEVAGSAGVYFDPNSPSSISRSIAKVLGDKGLKKKMVKRGKVIEHNFSWDKTAKKTLQIYKDLFFHQK